MDHRRSERRPGVRRSRRRRFRVGERAALAGGVYLLLVRVVHWRLPVAVLVGLVCRRRSSTTPAARRVWVRRCSTCSPARPCWRPFSSPRDPVTAPRAAGHQWLFGLGVGALVFAIRAAGSHPDGVGLRRVAGQSRRRRCWIGCARRGADSTVIDPAAPPPSFVTGLPACGRRACEGIITHFSTNPEAGLGRRTAGSFRYLQLTTRSFAASCSVLLLLGTGAGGLLAWFAAATQEKARANRQAAQTRVLRELAGVDVDAAAPGDVLYCANDLVILRGRRPGLRRPVFNWRWHGRQRRPAWGAGARTSGNPRLRRHPGTPSRVVGFFPSGRSGCGKPGRR